VRRRFCCPVLLAAAGLSACVTPPALAAGSAGPARWAVTSTSGPAYFKPASTNDVFIVTATNVGGEPVSGPVTIRDTLPTGVKAIQAPNGSPAGGNGGDAFTRTALKCPESTPPSMFTCTYPTEPGRQVAPGDTLTFTVPVEVTTATPGEELQNEATVSGGGAASASTSESVGLSPKTRISSDQVPFGVASLLATPSITQAGAHPNFTTSFTLNLSQAHRSAGSPRDLGVDLPAGLTGDPRAVPTCNIDYVRRTLCPRDTAVGVATVATGGAGEDLFTEHQVLLVYNITPYPNEPAAFAFSILGGTATARLDTSVIPKPGSATGDYAVHVSVPDINQSEPIVSSSVTLWGVPANFNGPGPDVTNETIEREGKHEVVTFGGANEAAPATAFLRNPTSCARPAPVGLEVDDWSEPGVFRSAESQFPTPVACELLSPLFTPALQVSPDTSQAGAPAGYAVNVEVPQSESEQTLATPDLRNATVTLPAGTVASPSAANGLEACSDSQFDRSSIEPASCPSRSQIGTLRIKTPLLERELTGQVYLGQPECAPCEASDGQPAAHGRLLRLFLQAQYETEPGEPTTGVRIKLAGRTHVNERTGQLTSVFEENPQQPFERLTIQLDGGPTAPLANPPTCGTATTTSQLVPWSSTPSAPFTAEPSSSFEVGGCTVAQFAPSFSAGMSASARAGAFSPLSVTFARSDQDQDLGGITVRTPPGLVGMVSHVTQCPEAQANAGACSQASEIGTVTVAAGPGPDPFWITGGKAYLTGPYKGAPFGLSIVVPAVAGPFNLGEEIVRAAIYIDPHTSGLTIVSDPLPTKKDGIPFQVKTVNVNVNRPQFTFNATSCDAMAIGATISSTQGVSAGVSSPYQAVNCANLPFKPSFTVSTQARTSKANGASLDVKVAERPGEANIHKVDTQLPIALPSRLTTLQKACGEAQFNANPAGCPPGSVVGIATAHTPVLNVPLTGPAFLVSHGGAAFPDLDVVLQGEGIKIELVGNTDIKKGITFSRFETVPDAPISTFELKLPEGPHSALAAFGNLCEQNLTMPTTIVGQNGAQVKQSTKISVTGCPPTVKVKKARVSGNTLLVTVTTTQKGTVTVGGTGLKTTKMALGAGTQVIKVPMTRVGKAARQRHKKTKIKVSAKNTQGSTSTTTSIRL
jgi:hypothetical protein